MYKLFVTVLMLAGAVCGGDAGAWRPRERWRGFNRELIVEADGKRMFARHYDRKMLGLLQRY